MTGRPTRSLDALTEETGDAAEPTDSAADPARMAATADLIQRLLASLAPDQRVILTLREVQGLSYQEMADVLRCSLDAVKARLRRARAALDDAARHFLKTDGVS